MRVQWNSNAVEQMRKRLWDARELSLIHISEPTRH